MDPRLGTAIMVVVGVPAVLVGYIYATEIGCCGSRPERLQRPAPAVAVARCRRSLFLVVFLVYPTIGTIIRSFQDKAGDDVRRPRQLRLVLHQRPTRSIALRNNVHLGRAADAVHRRARPAHRRPGRPGPLRAGGQVGDLRAAGDQHGRGRRDLEVHVRLPAAGARPRPARSTRSLGPFGIEPVAVAHRSTRSRSTRSP